jgi:hypothetical protein
MKRFREGGIHSMLSEQFVPFSKEGQNSSFPRLLACRSGCHSCLSFPLFLFTRYTRFVLLIAVISSKGSSSTLSSCTTPQADSSPSPTPTNDSAQTEEKTEQPRSLDDSTDKAWKTLKEWGKVTFVLCFIFSCTHGNFSLLLHTN